MIRTPSKARPAMIIVDVWKSYLSNVKLPKVAPRHPPRQSQQIQRLVTMALVCSLSGRPHPATPLIIKKREPI